MFFLQLIYVVIRIIKLCKPKDSMDYDDISMRVLSMIAPRVVKPLVHIFNLSFSTGIFPSEMKIAKVIGETGASCYNFHSKSIFHKNMQARDFF